MMKKLPFILLPVLAMGLLIPGFLLILLSSEGEYSSKLSSDNDTQTPESLSQGESPKTAPKTDSEDLLSENDPGLLDREPLPPDGHGICRVTGRVADPDGNPVPHADVELRLAYDPEGPEVWRTAVRAGADGSYSASLDGLVSLTPAARSSIRLSGLASAPGHYYYMWTEVDLPDPGSEIHETVLDLPVKPGVRLRGRVLSPDGQPSVDAKVYLRSPETGWVNNRKTDGNGHYEIPFRYEGPHLLAAIHSSKGISNALEIHLEPGKNAEAPDLVIRGKGVIEGIAVYPDGKPVAGLELQASSTLYNKYATVCRDAHPVDDEYVKMDGLLIGFAKTGPDGRFRFSGLQPGYFSIESPGREDLYDYEPPMVETGCKNARLVFSMYRVRLRVFDEKGNGIPGAKYTYSFSKVKNRSTASGGTIKSLDGTAYISGKFLEPSPRSTMEIEAWTPLTPTARTALEIREGTFEMRADLVLEQPESPCIVTLKVQNPEGGPIPAFKGEVWMNGSMRGRTSFHSMGKNGIRTLSMPAGRYRIFVHPEGEDPFNYFSDIAELEAVEGQKQDQTITLQPAGRFRMIVHPPPGYQELRLYLHRLRLEFLDVAKISSTPYSPKGPKGSHSSYARKTHILSRYYSRMKRHCNNNSSGDRPYISVPSTMLEPGRYTLHAEFHYCHPVEKAIRIQPKKTVDIELYLHLKDS